MSINETLSVAERLELVRLAKAAGLARSSAQLRAIVPVERSGPLALSFAQQRLWFFEQMEGAGAAYRLAMSLRLKGELDREALVRALDRLVARHESLRTTFRVEDGEPEQRIGPESTRFHLVEDDAAGEAGEALARVMDEEVLVPFDLERGPLIRGRLIRLAADDHVLLLTMHHIVADGWSMGVLVDELSRLYAAFRDGRPDPLPALPIQYADYAAWQRRWVEGAVLEAQAAYWAKTLAGAPELLELPADRPRPRRQDHAGAELDVVLDEALAAGLKALSRRHGATLFMTLLAGWATVLGRLSGQPEVVVGTVTANRSRPEVEGLIGFFINTLALRIDLSERPTVAEVIGRVRVRALDAQANQDIPFEQVVELVQPARSLSHTPLFQVAFDFQGARPGGLRLPGLELGEVAGAERTTAKVDLAMSLREVGGRIVGSATYATALFDRETVARYAGYLVRVLEEMVAGDRRRIESLRLLPDGERARVVEGWNATAAPYPRGTCVHELVEAQAARTPDAVAVVFGDQRLTYAELDGRANALARRLRDHGAGPGRYVPVLMDRCLEVPIAFLAVLKAGAAFVPLHPRWPVERLRAVVGELDAPVVLTAGAAEGRAPLGPPLLPVEGTGTAAPLGLRVDERAPMYAIYTSGSTGRPKAAVVAHRGVANRFHWMTETFGAESAAVMLQTVMHVFDGAVVQLLWPLTLGGRTVIPRPDGESDPDYLGRLGEDEGATMRGFVPSILRTFVAQLAAGGGEGRRQLVPLRSVILSGEQLDAEATYAFMAHVPWIRVFNMYGPTEATIGSIGHELTADGRGRIPIGRPIANTRAYLLDPAMEPVPVGVTGEIYLGGVCVGLGYLRNPGKTAAAFVPDPFGEPGARLYRTGDLGRWRPDGVIEFLGRADTQVKVRGFRIELGEIEARLREHAGVRDAVVVARDDAAGDRRLVAYHTGDASVGADALRAHLGERLPEYMVPAAYVRLEALPLTPNGKVDRRALPAPGDDAYARRGYEAPVGEVERALAEIWSGLLGVERVGRRDDFFELGGHSLLLVQVISRIRQVLDAEVEIGLVFERPVLAELAEALAAAGRADLPAIERADRGARLPLSFAQQRLWFIEQLGNLGSTYHIPGRLRLRGALDRAALVRALDRLVARHEALRTTFAVRDGEPEQRIAPETTRFHLVEDDLSGEAGDALERVMAGEATAPFDLERGPLIRGRLVRLAEDDHVLLLTMHHIVSDGWSMGVLLDELGRLYGAFRDGLPDPLPPLPIQYADYAAWQRRWVEDRVLEAQAGYWAKTLAGAPPVLELPTDHPRPSRQDHVGASVRLALDEASTAGLKALSRRHGTTLFMTLLAGWAAVLGRLSGQDDVVVGTPTANRGRREIEGLIGFFVNMLALRVDLSDRPTVAEVLGRVKARALEAQQNQDIPFEEVVDLLQPARSLSHTPLFQAVFTWHDAPRAGVGLPGLRLGSVPGAEQTTAKFDLSLALSEADGRIVGGLTYATSLYERETMERHVGYLLRALEAMAADERQGVDRLPLLPEAERRLVVEEWNATTRPYPAGACVHDLFRAQAARTPGAVALSWRGERWTYAELEARANRLANVLRRRGVGPEVRVGICLPRTPEVVAAMLGVLGAGGAYVPLDPAYPRQRLGWMLEDASAALVITDSTFADRLPVDAAALLLLDRERDAVAAESAASPESGAVPENLSHVIFTSGSTGRPKGVMIRHASTVVLLHWLRENVTDHERSSVLFSTSINFDVSVAEVFGTLGWGGKLVLAENALELATLGEEVVHVSMVPSAAEELLRGGGIPACVKTLNLGGEALPSALAQGLYALGTVEKVGNLYGPTEDTTYSTYYVVPRGADEVLVGTPVANTRAYVLDAHLHPVPIGIVGELYLAGDGLSRGYANRPAMTAERFLPCPFGAPGSRMYRVMDRVRRRADGEIEYLGRTDFQVKVRGYRIEPGEIEVRLAEHPGVREAVVLAREDAPGDRRLVAYYTGDAPLDAESLRGLLGERLPEYMVPAAYVHLERLPLTPNGKLDRGALPAPGDDAYARQAYEAPVGETEEALAEIWAELLGVERVGRHDNFFELGGHSLLIVTLIERMRQRGLQAEVGTLFATPVLAELAAATRRLREVRI